MTTGPPEYLGVVRQNPFAHVLVVFEGANHIKTELPNPKEPSGSNAHWNLIRQDTSESFVYPSPKRRGMRS